MNKQYDLAIADYSEVIRLEPKNASAYSNRGNCYKEDRYDLAIKDYTEAIRLNPVNVYFHAEGIIDSANSSAFFLHYSRGLAYKAKGQYDLAKLQNKCTYENGDTYEGEFADGKRHGKGKFTFADGGILEGYFVDDGQSTLSQKEVDEMLDVINLSSKVMS